MPVVAYWTWSLVEPAFAAFITFPRTSPPSTFVPMTSVEAPTSDLRGVSRVTSAYDLEKAPSW
jgi:hypothetical protein